MNSETTVNIVVPLYNEEVVLRGSVEKLINFLKQSAFPYRYVVTLVNNASTDSSAKIMEELAKKYQVVRPLHLERKGKGLAIRTAWKSANENILVFMDADMSSDLNSFKPLIDAVSIEGYEMAIGNRLGKNSVVISRRNTRKLMSKVYNWLIRFLFGTKIADHQCGFKAISREAYRAIEPRMQDEAWFIDTELIVLGRKNGYKIKEIDITWVDRSGSKVHPIGTSYKLFKAAIDLRRRI